MSKYTIVKFTNMTPMHLGLGRDAYDAAAPMLHSDTIASALAAIRVMQGNDADVKEFLDSFAVSSAYPYAGDEMFMPKPCGRLGVTVRDKAPEAYRKQLKKVRYVSFGLWKALIGGQDVAVDETQLQGAYLLDAPNAKFSNPVKEVINQRVTVPRIDGDAMPFNFNWTFFGEGCGLYCFVKCAQGLKDELISLFKQLGDAGIGSDRSVGGGHFNVETKEIDLPDVQDGNATMLLSMYMPSTDEFNQLRLSESKYEIATRGGFMAGSNHDALRRLRKNTVSMFVPGSIFIGKPELKGIIVDLRPNWNNNSMHPVYRSGKPISLTIKMM